MSPLPRWLRIFLVLVLFLFVAPLARASPTTMAVYSVWYAEDTTDAVPLEEFLHCLVQSSTFPRWAAEWGASVTMHGPFVIPTRAPPRIANGSHLERLIAEAIDAGFVPAPAGNYDTVYLVHAPRTTRAENTEGKPFC